MILKDDLSAPACQCLHLFTILLNDFKNADHKHSIFCFVEVMIKLEQT